MCLALAESEDLRGSDGAPDCYFAVLTAISATAVLFCTLEEKVSLAVVRSVSRHV